MTKHITIPTVALAILLASGTAAADKQQTLQQVANDIYPYADFAEYQLPEGNKAEALAERRKNNQCTAILAAAKKKGVKDDDIVIHNVFDKHPKAEKQPKGAYGVAFKDLGWFCEDYAQKLDKFDVQLTITWAVQARNALKNGISDDQAKALDGVQVDYMAGRAKRCHELATELKLPADAKLEARGIQTTFGELPGVCDEIQKYADLMKEAFQKEFEKRAEKYRAVGIKGQRLDLFAYYDGLEWYSKGCKSSTADPKKLKKAKALFQWLTDSDGIITIRKYAFKGDTYKVTEKTFLTEAKAYKGCK